MTDPNLYVTSYTHTSKGDKPVYDKSLYNAGQKTLAAASASTAAAIFVAKFERPRDTKGQIPFRSKIATSIFNFESSNARSYDNFKQIILRASVS